MIDLHAKNKSDIMPLYEQLKKEEKDYKVYLKTNMPEHFHYGANDDRMNRIGDILVIPGLAQSVFEPETRCGLPWV